MEKSSNKEVKKVSSPKNNTTPKKRVRRREPSSLSSDALLEEILAKRAEKKASIQKRKTLKSKLTEDVRSNDDILDEILARKRKRKGKQVEAKVTFARKKRKGKIVLKDDVSNEIVIKVIEESFDKKEPMKDEVITYQEIQEALRKEEQKEQKNRLKKIIPLSIGVLFCLVLLFVFIVVAKNEKFVFQSLNQIDITYDNRPSLVEACMQEAVSLEDNPVIQAKENELNTYLSSTYKASVSYEINGYNYSYRSSELYYAASTIKALDALYIYTHASYGDLSLDETMTYSAKYQRSSSKGLASYPYGSQISLRDLVKYAVVYSDNSAHIMLLDYIGQANLREFGVSHVGAVHTLSFSDSFGYLTSWDGLSIMRGVHQFIENNGELGSELQGYFLSAEQNDLEMPDLGILASHKYGEYGSVYHDMGIVYDTYPYIVAIFTAEGAKKNHEDIIRDINRHVYSLHQTIYAEKENICKTRVYQ